MSNPVYPFFRNLEKYTLDPFWIGFLEKCATNKFPSRLKYDQNSHSLIISTKSSRSRAIKQNINLPSDEKKALTLITNIAKTKLGLVSSRDLSVSLEKEENVKNNSLEFKDVKPKSLKESLINDYILLLSQKYNLSQIEIKSLESLIHLGFQFKTLDHSMVIYNGEKITSIKNIKYNRKDKCFLIDIPLSLKKQSKTEKKELNDLDIKIKRFKSTCEIINL